MQREHFEALIKGLEASGVSRTEIARECHVSRATVWRLAEGVVREPAFSTGQRIEQFYFRAVSPVKQKIG